ncbi:Serpin I2 [Thelohanellus kitauei]|uniref:Serpin I2 n=1 Tax=Thelohanellus kitauei TaxID=669202 RepID=A0A0C2JAA3_THEKT|nr:Serpin I2 [Thelohanellus kitauei]
MNERSEIYSKIFSRMALNDKYAHVLETVFKSTIEAIDFHNKKESVAKINSWVSDCTHNRINDILTESQIHDNIAFVLINIIFFKSEWKNKFNSKDSYFGEFYQESGSEVKAEFMTQKCIVRLFDDEQNRFQALSLDFKSNDLVGLFVLPSEGKTVKDLISILTFTDLKKCIDLSYSSDVEVSVPKFKIKSKSSIKEILGQMGVKEIFDGQRCNLENISDHPLFVEDIIHSSTVEIDEKGVVAAAATEVTFAFRCAIQTKEFILNRPFLFVIWDRQTNLPLFVNAIHDPTKH